MFLSALCSSTPTPTPTPTSACSFQLPLPCGCHLAGKQLYPPARGAFPPLHRPDGEGHRAAVWTLCDGLRRCGFYHVLEGIKLPRLSLFVCLSVCARVHAHVFLLLFLLLLLFEQSHHQKLRETKVTGKHYSKLKFSGKMVVSCDKNFWQTVNSNF